MAELSSEDILFIDTAVRIGVLSIDDVNELLADFDEDRDRGKRDNESLGPFLVRVGLISIEQLYQTAVQLQRGESSSGPSSSGRHPSQGDSRFGLVISNHGGGERRESAARILAELRNMSLERARNLLARPFAPLTLKLSRQEAETTCERLREEQIHCQIVRWKRPTASLSRSRSQSLSGRLGRLDAPPARDPTARPTPRSASARLNIPKMAQDPAVNPFAQPISEPPARALLDSAAINYDSVDHDSLDHDLGAASECDVIFLDENSREHTDTAITLFADSEIVSQASSAPVVQQAPRREAPRNPRDDDTLGPGAMIGGYRLRELLGRGGFAKVYLGEHHQLGHRAAVKVYRTRDAKILRRITRREANLISRLRHPRLVSILNIGQDAGSFYVIMEYVAGSSIAQLLKAQGPLGCAATLRMALDIAEALHYFHANGLVHRDVKPSNILLEPDGRGRLLDFELIRSFHDDAESEAITESGQLLGTPRFMSPEQIDDARSVGPASDIYSFGATLYYTISGRYPFPGKSLIQVVKQVLVRNPDPLSSFIPMIPEPLENLIHRMLAKDPAHRPADMAQVLTELKQIQIDTGLGDPRIDAVHRAMAPMIERAINQLPGGTDTLVIPTTNPTKNPETNNPTPLGLDADDIEASTEIFDDVQAGKLDTDTAIVSASLLQSEPQPAVTWESLAQDSSRQRWLDQRTAAELNAPELAAAREWRDKTRCANLLREAQVLIDDNDLMNAILRIEEALTLRPEHENAYVWLTELDEPAGVDLPRVKELARNGNSQLYRGLAELIHKEVPLETLLETCTRYNSKPSELDELLKRRRASAWLITIVQELFFNTHAQGDSNSNKQADSYTASIQLLASLGFRVHELPNR